MKLQTSIVAVLASAILTSQTILAAIAAETTSSITTTSAVDDQTKSAVAATSSLSSNHHTATLERQHTHLNQNVSNSTTASLNPHSHNHTNITDSTTISHNHTHHNSNSSLKANSLLSSTSSSTLGPWKNVSKNMGQPIIAMAPGMMITICASVAGTVAVLGAL